MEDSWLWCVPCMMRGKERRLKRSVSRHVTDLEVIDQTTHECPSCGYTQYQSHTVERTGERVNKPKKDGTEFETKLVNHFIDHDVKAERLAEGGMADLGDLRVYGVSHHWDGHEYQVLTEEWIIEAKRRQVLNPGIHVALAKAKAKAGNHPVALIWKRLTKSTDGARRRTPVKSRDGTTGESIIVAIDLDTFTALIGGNSGPGSAAGD